jgi:hypothetical protein
MDAVNMNTQGQNPFFSPVSLSQILTTSSKVDIVLPTSNSLQLLPFPFGILAGIPIDPIESNPDLKTPRLPGLAKGRILRVDPDFDAASDFGS